MWVADDNADRIWEIDPTTGAYKSQLRGGSRRHDFLTATNVEHRRRLRRHGRPDHFAADGMTLIDTAALECLSRTDDFESVVYDPSARRALRDLRELLQRGPADGLLLGQLGRRRS